MSSGKYKFKEIESKWYSHWVKEGIFSPSDSDKTFSMVVPPPNITGILHMGHVLNCSIQDAIVRYKRMKGFSVLWIPGLDHAGIATENKVEESLRKEGKRKAEIGRDEFIKRVWNWKEKHGNIIFDQFQKLGLSLDWSKSRFTMDPEIQQGVKECFVRLYEQGLVYRGEYMVNWSPGGQTALSDDEVNPIEMDQKLVKVAYRLEGEDGEIVIATTRPETIPADSAIAVNPSDKRYKHLIGKKAIVPLVERHVPIIGDDEVKEDFGTGALKVTPAHSFTDFEIGKRHNLAFISVLDQRAIFSFGMKYDGMSREKARGAIVEDLEAAGLVRGYEKNISKVGTCYRTGDIVEPMISNQWFVKMEPLAKKAINAVEKGDVKIRPKKWEKVYFHWLNNIKDWCISRQIWWGHSIPEYFKDGKSVISREDLSPKGYVASEDVLDTWFSSWLWPFIVMGWPHFEEKMKKYYPTSLIVTGGDIIFFWVARMIMASQQFLDVEPFKEVLFHGIVRDEQGRKMSKSLGNSPDPLKIIEEYGADSLRFGMLYNNNLGEDLFYSKEWLIMGRNLCNKVWNVNNFINLNGYSFLKNKTDLYENISAVDKWILSRFNSTLKNFEKHMEEQNLSLAAKDIYNFFWGEFCDKYLEMVKISKGSSDIFVYLFGETLKLLHPFIPFVTEEIWNKLPHNGDGSFIAISSFPTLDESIIDRELEEEFEGYFDLIRTVRNARVELNIPKSNRLLVHLKAKADLKCQEHFLPVIKSICNFEISNIDETKGSIVTKISSHFDILISIKDVETLSLQTQNIRDSILKVKMELEKVEAKLQDQEFIKKAPEQVVEKNRKKEMELLKKIESLEAQLKKGEGL